MYATEVRAHYLYVYAYFQLTFSCVISTIEKQLSA